MIVTSPPRSAVDQAARLARLFDDQLMRCSFIQRLGRLDLDAKAGEPDIGTRARRVQLDRADPEIAQDLCAKADLAPLPATLELGGRALFGKRRRRHPRGAVAEINEDTPAGFLEARERGMDRLRAAKHV